MRRIEKSLGGLLLLVALTYSAQRIGLLDLSRLSRGFGNLGELVYEVLPPNPAVLPETLMALLETIQMALVGTFIGFTLSLPLSTLGLRTIFPSIVTVPIRIVLSIIRTIPALFWAIIYVIAVGLGPLAGTLAIATYTVGYLSKLYYEAFESVDTEILDTLRCAGASKFSLIRFAIIPESMNALVSQLLFIFEYNIRSSAVLGFVGAGGVGFLMVNFIERLQYQSLSTTIVSTLLIVLFIDLASSQIRRRYLPQLQRPHMVRA
ncbi:Phosphate-import permease protein PhnE [archaeon HR01]|nr:Phosphate-import permease protein PhnE [archaeon HR01]